MKKLSYKRFEENGRFYRQFDKEPLSFMREIQGAIQIRKEPSGLEIRQEPGVPSENNNRTFRAIWTTGARVYRMGFEGPFGMELSLASEHVRMGRLKSGAPVLDNHDSANLCGVASGLHGRSKGQIGVVENADLSADKGLADLRLSRRKDVDDIALDMQDGIIRNISVGFNIHKVEELGEDEDGIPVFRAVDWEPMEISPVKVNADAPAQTVRNLVDELCEKALINEEDKRKLRSVLSEEKNRTADSVEFEDEKEASEPSNEEAEEVRQDDNAISKNKGVENPEKVGETHFIQEREEMPKENQKPEQDTQQLTQEAREQEKKRAKDIRSIVSKIGLEEKYSEQWIDEDKTVDEVRTLAIDLMAERDSAQENETRSDSPVEVGEDLSRKGRVEGMTNALLHRHRPQSEWLRHNGASFKARAYELNEAGRQFAYLSLVDMARACLEANNIRTAGKSKQQIASDALKMRSLHSISDFPEILANVANKTLRDGYTQAPRTFMPFTREVSVSDFKEISRTNLSAAPELQEVPEGGEIQRGNMDEAAEKYSIAEFARIVGITRRVIINDDLSAFTRIPERMGRRAADLESDLVWDIFKDNANLADGIALFAAQHGNLATDAGAPNEGRLADGRAAMRRQKGLKDEEISLVPSWLYVPPALETSAEKLVANVTPDSSTNVSPFSASGRTPLQLGVEPRLENESRAGTAGSLTAWFMTADLGQIDMIELARLEGADGPQTESRDGFDVSGVEIKVMHDVGAKAIDFRGLFKNAGA